MTKEEKAKAYDKALEQAKKELKTCGSMDCDAARQIFRFFPELRESEDERTRKSLIKFLTDIKEISESGRTTWAVRKEDAEMCKSFIAYLEKQKEEEGYEAIPVKSTLEYKLGFADGRDYEKQKEPHYTKRNALFDKCVENCDPEVMKEVSDKVDEMLGKEQKPVQDETEREYVRTIKSIIADFIRDKKPEDVGYYQQIYDWLDGRHIEQKPDDDPLDDPKFLKGFDTGREVQRIFDEQKPVEWSEEDVRMLQTAIEACNTVAEDYENSNERFYKCKNWLKSLRPQPKQVWTEEDDRICHLIMANLSESARHAITLPMETVNDFNNWLRTLQCMPPVFTDWNEEDQTLLSDALGCVTMVQELKKRGKLKNFHISCSYDELRSWVRSLKSRPRKQPQWKPSEEQMKALYQAAQDAPIDREDGNALYQLYEQLKKLIQ